MPSSSTAESIGRASLLSPWDIIRVARPGLMASHLWLFFLPLILGGASPDLAFWVGAVYVTVPLGLLIYGWNDFFDADVDALSRRKKETRVSRFFGYRLSAEKRKLVPVYIVASQLPFLALAVISGQLSFLGWFAVMVFANWLYNGPGPRLSRVPVVAELIATGIYLSILWLGVSITGLQQPWEVWILAAAAVLFFQIGGAIVDIKADRSVGKITFAAWIGESWASKALSAVVSAKAAVLLVGFSAFVPAALNLVAVPFCLARPTFSKYQWSGMAYGAFVVIDWITLGLVATWAVT